MLHAAVMPGVREIQLSVRIRPCSSSGAAVDVGPDGDVMVLPSGERFPYPAQVVKGSDQAAAFDAIASVLIARARDGFNCTLMCYGQTGSGKTHTMFGPPGCLTESAMQQASASDSPVSSAHSIPDSWGLFPRAVMNLMQIPGVTLHASAVEVYHESVFDLLDDRAQLTIGSTKPMGNKVAGRAESGNWGNAALAINGVHPASCTCMRCFKVQEEAKRAQEAARRARQEQAAEAAAAKLKKTRPTTVTTKTIKGESPSAPGPPPHGTHAAASVAQPPTRTSLAARKVVASAGDHDGFATVGEQLVLLQDPVAVARFARTVEATRTAKSHHLNERSSRSHCLVKLHIKRRSDDGGKGVRMSTFLFVDLAGSERINRTGAEGSAKAEAQSINSSLSALGRVIKALGAHANKGGNAHVPYRDAALTMLLRDSFGGSSCTAVVINVAAEPEHAEESVCSLRYGQRMSVVRNAPTVVVDSAERNVQEIATALQHAQAQLAQMAADGFGGGFVDDAPPSEKESLANNMRNHDHFAKEARDLVAQISEARTSGTDTGALELRLQSCRKHADNLNDLVERQQTIKKLWSQPTQAFKRKEAEVKCLQSRLNLALGL